ncbi:centrosomal protein of 104 kDa isoform X2 [Fukomys damarensis]|uniref:centrosomal protein of 104 kDa isoform X2 n=1 Tax=Fukomys damarensis TaxID=885580 RepID=UPI00053F5A4C|nr:centrosomal protein of 104 kDa isoform X2 [Fukomys damarensis]
MPHKIGFVVVSSSGHEDGFSARELMIHAPTVSGWRSPRFCQFPQEIVLQMVERCRIRKLQLLAHQYMISSKIEFYISESLPDYFVPYQTERFRRLGYVSLCDNEKTGCKARELKSVYVDAVGQFLKLIFHQNHVNKYNIYNQVALVAINIIGDPADFGSESKLTSREKLMDHYLGHSPEDPALEATYVGRSDYISPLDDLAFDMYQDPEVAQIIRRLDERKREAVQRERYDHAKKLKQAIADLQKVGERLGRYEVEKRCAVEKEDYDLAKEKKQQMAHYRAQVYEQLALHGLLQGELEVQRPLNLPLQPLAHANSPRCRKPEPSLPLPQEMYPESQPADPLVQEQPASPVLTPPRRSAADQPPPVLGPGPQSAVFQASLKLLKVLITQYVPKHKLGRPEIAHCVERTMPALLARTGDSCARLRVAASNFIQEMALCEEVRALQMVPSYLVQPLKPNCSARLAMSQMDLLARLLRDLGTAGTGFNVDSVMRFTVSALEHRVYKVRETAVKVILDMYAQHQALVLEFLPPDDSSSRRNLLYKTIFEGFARIDGRPTHAQTRAQKKAATEEAEKRKKEEIKVLQGQLAALKEIQAETEEKESNAEKPRKQDSPSRKAAPTDTPEVPGSHYLDNLCIFCGERSAAFTEEGLDLHYWKHCLMLTRCSHCRQVVEIASLTEHLLTECDSRDAFGKCYRCSEAMLKEELPRHIKAKACAPAKSEKLANRCPLCHENFAPGEEAWKAHLMGPAGCTMNLRKTQPKAPAPQQGKGPTTAKMGTSGTKVGSKIPTPKGGLNKISSRTYSKQ